jgi:hypothetical protein
MASYSGGVRRDAYLSRHAEGALAKVDRCDNRAVVIILIFDAVSATSSFFFIIPQSDPPRTTARASGDAS